MPSRARVFASNASVAATFQPWIAPTPLLREGAFVGYQLRTGRAAFYDPMLLKKGVQRRIRGNRTKQVKINSTVVDINGLKDHGKTTLVKSLTCRLGALQAGMDASGEPLKSRVRINDRKHESGNPEYQAVTEYLLSEVVELANVGSINIFDPAMGMTEMDVTRTAINVMVDVKNANLDTDETRATQIAVHRMMTTTPRLASPEVLQVMLGQLSQADTKQYLEDINQALRDQYRQAAKADDEDDSDTLESLLGTQANLLTEPDQLRSLSAAATRCSSYLDDLLHSGRYGNLFGGKRSIRELLTPEMVTLDWTGLPPAGAELLEGMLFQWMQIGSRNNDFLTTPTVNVGEEEGSELNGLLHARYMDETFRKSRGIPTTFINVTQYVTDYLQLGAPGSELRQLGQSINKSFGMRLYGWQPSDDDTLHIITQQGVSDADAYALTKLEDSPGVWGVLIPGQPLDFVQHVLVPDEVPLIRSNTASAALTNRVPVHSVDRIQDRIRRLGAINLGEDS
jgi:hypothetical protein